MTFLPSWLGWMDDSGFALAEGSSEREERAGQAVKVEKVVEAGKQSG